MNLLPNTATLHWRCARFDELSSHELYAILQARQEVFVVEQQCPYLDADGADARCEHLWAWMGDASNDSATTLAAYARIVPPGVKFAEASFGRVITTQAARGTGAGKELVRRAIERLRELYPNTPLRIAAQRYLENFYGSFGFVPVGEPYLEDDIPHVDMILHKQ
jgi:ElaA protein